MKKNSTMLAIEKFCKKNDPTRVKRKNEAPEAEFVKNELLPFLRSIGASVTVIESKAVFSEKMGVYMGSNSIPGFPDICGVFSNGLGLFIEAKAPGKRSTIRPQQYDFLVEKIKSNAFAACIDSVSDLKSLIDLFKHSTNRKQLLMDHLPSNKNRKEDEDLNLE